jgi:hypothetical protein
MEITAQIEIDQRDMRRLRAMVIEDIVSNAWKKSKQIKALKSAVEEE